MAFKTILTVVGTEAKDRDIKLAAGLCEEADAHLSVLVTELASPPPIGGYVAVVSAAWLEAREADEKRRKARAGAVMALLAAEAISADVSSEYTEITWADETVGRRAQYADLTFVGPELLSSELLKEKVIEGALFSSGKPLLIVPGGFKPALKPKRVVVAWDSRIEASRAVREALDLLVGAEDVRLALVDPIAGDQGEEPALTPRPIWPGTESVTVDRLSSEGRSVADTLRRHAVDRSAELLVMGGYGHSRLRERIFGGVTKAMLDEPLLPILMAR